MPGRTRSAAAGAATPSTSKQSKQAALDSQPSHPHRNDGVREGGGYGPGLTFNQALTWRAGKPIPVADLLSRLKTLAAELRKVEQETVDRDTMAVVSQDLANGQLLSHKDPGVRALTTCCIVDLLRVCAPDAPFTGKQLKVG